MSYELLKVVHIVSATLLFGTGLGSAFYKWMADRSGDLVAIARTNKTVVIADWIFTTPAVLLQPISGFMLARVSGFSLDQFWLLAGLALYVFAGLCWFPVVYLQIRMRKCSQDALCKRGYLDENYWRDARIWFVLGVPAFSAVIVIFGLMVFKPVV